MSESRTRAAIKKRLLDLQTKGAVTTKNEPVSFAAIGRTCDPPVSRVAVSQTAAGVIKCARIREAIERELQQPCWVRRKS
jgi:hypothetical protein